MRPKKHETTRSGDLFRARLDQIINLKHELAQLADAIDWDWIDGEIAPLYSEKGRPGIERAVGMILELEQGLGGQYHSQSPVDASPPVAVRSSVKHPRAPRRRGGGGELSMERNAGILGRLLSTSRN